MEYSFKARPLKAKHTESELRPYMKSPTVRSISHELSNSPSLNNNTPKNNSLGRSLSHTVLEEHPARPSSSKPKANVRFYRNHCKSMAFYQNLAADNVL